MSDGWVSPTHSEYKYTNASVYAQAWVFSSSDIVFTQTDIRGSGISVSSTITMPRSFDIDTHLFLVQVSNQYFKINTFTMIVYLFSLVKHVFK